MRTLRLSLVEAVILILLGALTGVAVARTDGSASVTGWVLSQETVKEPVTTHDGEMGSDYVGHSRRWVYSEELEWSDPRLPSQAEAVMNLEVYGYAGTAYSGTWLLEDPDGSWSGPWTGWCEYWPRCYGTVTLTGHGAYEGFFAVLTEQPREDASGTVTQMLEGAILAGEMPPVPEPLEPSVEAQASVDEFLTNESAAEPAAWSGATVEVLSDVGVIPLEAIPEDADHVTFARISTEPGVSGEVGSGQPQRWANLEYVDEGVSIATIAERSRIWRADGTIEDIPAGVASSASAGDTVLFYNGAAAMAFENGPDEYVSFFVGAGNSHNQETPQVGPPGSEWRHLDYIFPPRGTAEAWFSAPIAVTYERITWEPGAQLVLGSDEVPMLSFIWLESGELKYREVPADEVSQANLNIRLPSGGTWRGLPPADGNVHVLRNEGKEPTVAVGVTLSHASDTEPG